MSNKYPFRPSFLDRNSIFIIKYMNERERRRDRERERERDRKRERMKIDCC